jgi:murein DD-endopeptidase MepM/ murein hydrolase activator NlpD
VRATWLVVFAAAGLLQACDREPVRTTVTPPSDAAVAQAAPAPPAAKAAVAVPQPLPQAVPVAHAQAPADGAALLAQHELVVPVEGVAPQSLVDTYRQARAGHMHEALDIMAPRGTRVLAVDDGRLVKLFKSVPGGLTVYQFDPTGRLAYYYAHLDRYADGLREGMALHRGDLLGYVGSTGDASPEAPHLHFAVFLLGPERQWWKGEAVNPYAALRQAQGVPTQK